MNHAPRIQFISGSIISLEGSKQKFGTGSDKSTHQIDFLEVNVEGRKPVLLRDVAIIGSAAEERLSEGQHIELVVSLNKPRADFTATKVIERNVTLVYALRSNAGEWHGKDVCVQLGKMNEEMGKYSLRVLLLCSPILALLIASVVLAGPALLLVYTVLKAKKQQRIFKPYYPGISEIRAFLESNTSIRI